ncbi:hypothetical protein DRO97_11005 [Archaeoglobales archaeon]|nr:MAG: hypothetical protein DRO97_11005 [Archaeoglobales archaeon]
MATIKQNFGEGGANLTPKAQGSPSLAEALRDIADDLAMLKAALDQLINDYNNAVSPTTASTTDLKTQKG